MVVCLVAYHRVVVAAAVTDQEKKVEHPAVVVATSASQKEKLKVEACQKLGVKMEMNQEEVACFVEGLKMEELEVELKIVELVLKLKMEELVVPLKMMHQ